MGQNMELSVVSDKEKSAVSDPWIEVCGADDVWEGEMTGVDVGDEKVLLVNIDGDICAYDNRCPHAGTLLSEGKFENNMVICSSHLWEFDAETGKGINPSTCRLRRHPVKVENEVVLIKFGPKTG